MLVFNRINQVNLIVRLIIESSIVIESGKVSGIGGDIHEHHIPLLRMCGGQTFHSGIYLFITWNLHETYPLNLGDIARLQHLLPIFAWPIVKSGRRITRNRSINIMISSP